jgi:hypothetical protein
VNPFPDPVHDLLSGFGRSYGQGHACRLHGVYSLQARTTVYRESPCNRLTASHWTSLRRLTVNTVDNGTPCKRHATFVGSSGRHVVRQGISGETVTAPTARFLETLSGLEL